MGNAGQKSPVNQSDINATYKKGAMIGKGSFASVFEYKSKADGTAVAVKTIRKKQLSNDKEYVKLQNEILIMKSVVHENIVNFIDVFETTKKFHIVQELCVGGHLLQRLGKRKHYSEKQAAKIIHQLADVCQHMHKNGIVHRDLKPENILFRGPPPDEVIKVTDFGMSTLVKNAWEKNLMTPCGTPAFVAPEVIRRVGYNCECDLWSVGVILYILVSGYPPFYGSSLQKLLVRVTKAQFDFRPSPFKKVSAQAKEIIRGLLVLDPHKRMTTEELLAKDWCQGVDCSTHDLPDVKNRLHKIAVMNRFKRSVHLAIAACTLKDLAGTVDPNAVEQQVCLEDALSMLAHRSMQAKSPAPRIPPKAKSNSSVEELKSEVADPDASQKPVQVE